jgi:hypothetical protein
MTEAEWLAATDPRPMLEFLRGKASDRKLRLFAIAALRIARSPCSKELLALVERCVDGVAKFSEVGALFEFSGSAEDLGCARLLDAIPFSTEDVTRIASDVAREAAQAESTVIKAAATMSAMQRTQCALLRDLIRNPASVPAMAGPAAAVPAAPFRPRTTAQLVAKAAYAERRNREGTLDIARLAVLGDALEDTGCTDAELLGHLRGPGPHVRGCWALDLVLSKS